MGKCRLLTFTAMGFSRFVPLTCYNLTYASSGSTQVMGVDPLTIPLLGIPNWLYVLIAQVVPSFMTISVAARTVWKMYKNKEWFYPDGVWHKVVLAVYYSEKVSSWCAIFLGKL
jgi:hypothetical protein